MVAVVPLLPTTPMFMPKPSPGNTTSNAPGAPKTAKLLAPGVCSVCRAV